MSRKKKRLLDEIINCLVGVASLSFTFLVASIVFWKNNTKLIIQLAILLIATLALAIFLASIKGLKSSKKQQLSIARPPQNKPKPSEDAAQRKYRQFFGVSEEKTLYHINEFYAPFPFYTTQLEQQVAQDLASLKAFNPRCIFLDVFLKDKDSEITQIDLIAVGKRGVFVVEIKDYSGWIFGNGSQTTWTQTIYRSKNHFYNPIKQNKKHISALKTLLGKDIKCHSIVVFSDNATLKDISYIPKDTYVLTRNKIHQMLVDIYNGQPECLTGQEVLDVCRKINNNRLESNDSTRDKHIKNINEKIGKSRLYS